MTTTAIAKAEFYNQEYQRLRREDEPKNLEHYEVAKRFAHLNRYVNVLPNEPTRVAFHRKSRYFNANWMLERTAIASQGPRDTDLKNFFYMIRKRNVEVVVTLTNPVEGSKNKCFEYWAGFTGKVIYQDGDEKIVQREIRLQNCNPITHFHLENWFDYNLVKPETLEFLVRTVDEVSRGKILLAHCSAGIGRTGTFLATLDAYRKKTSDVFLIAKAIRHPETGRVGSIQNSRQYGLIYETLERLL